MTYDKKESLSPLLESENQIHLTIYLENRGDVADFKHQIKTCLSEAAESLEPVLSPDEQKILFQPIQGFLEGARMLKKLKGNIGIFRTKSGFRVLSIPIAVRRSAHVASTFHVKPLLQWMQWDSEFLLLGLDADAAHLYLGSQETLRKIDTVLFPQRLASLLKQEGALNFSETRELKEETRKAFTWVSDWISVSVPKPGLKLFVAGGKPLVDRFMEHQEYKRTVKTPVAQFFSEERVQEITFRLRAHLRAQTKKSLEQALQAFRIADEMNLTRKNIREIARAAVQGKVRKLIIAENREVYGKIDRLTGHVSVHPFDLDHEDDDLLDDLAQRVLLSGGEVYLAKKEEIPGGRPLLAIMEEESGPNEMRVGREDVFNKRSDLVERKVAI